MALTRGFKRSIRARKAAITSRADTSRRGCGGRVRPRLRNRFRCLRSWEASSLSEAEGTRGFRRLAGRFALGFTAIPGDMLAYAFAPETGPGTGVKWACRRCRVSPPPHPSTRAAPRRPRRSLQSASPPAPGSRSPRPASGARRRRRTLEDVDLLELPLVRVRWRIGPGSTRMSQVRSPAARRGVCSGSQPHQWCPNPSRPAAR